MGEELIVVWMVEGRAELPESLAGASVRIVPTRPNALGPTVLREVVAGAVLVVAGDLKDVQEALRSGADEVLVTSELSPSGLERAAQRALLRARARRLREGFTRDHVTREGSASLLLLTSAIAHEMNNPLMAASLNCELLRHSIAPLLGAFDEFARTAGKRDEPLPIDEVRRLLAIRASAPSTTELRAAVEDLEVALKHAAEVVERMSQLSTLQGPQQPIDLRELVWEIASMVRSEVERVAEFTVDVTKDECAVALPRGFLLQIVAALLHNSLEAVVERGAGRGKIEIALLVKEDVALLEICDDGIGMSEDVRHRCLEPFFTTRRPGSLGLGLTLASAYVHRAGGEILIDSEREHGTIVRVFFPRVRSATSAGNPHSAN